MKDRAITYHSLASKYDGDFTKGCSLIASEIDGNFFFLRGADIVSAEYVKDESGTTTLVLTKVNGEKIKTEAVVSAEYDFKYDKTTHTLTITYPNGKEVVLNQSNEKMATSNGIKGNGLYNSPVRLAVTERTGTYAPAEKVVEIDYDGLMPDGALLGKGYRIVTKESISSYGKLYDYKCGVKNIIAELAKVDSEWHIPSKEEWDGLLNAAEYDYNPCEELDEHESKERVVKAHSAVGNGIFGEVAGAALKEAGYKTWGPLDDSQYKGTDTYGLSILPLGYAGPRGFFLNDSDNDIEGYHQCAAFWTSTEAGIVTKGAKGDSVYAKVFDDNTNGVGQLALPKTARLSVRLVKDYDGENFNEYEEILGRFYPCKHIVINDLDGNPLYSKIWITVNFDNNDELFGGIASDEWEQPWYGEYNGDAKSVDAEFVEKVPSAKEIDENSPAFVKTFPKNFKTYQLFNSARYEEFDGEPEADKDKWLTQFPEINDDAPAEVTLYGKTYKLVKEYWYDPITIDPFNNGASWVTELPEAAEDAPLFVALYDEDDESSVVYKLYKNELKDRFFICEWNGKQWEKKMMAEGDSVVIVNHEGAHLHEWRVFSKDDENHELIDVVAQMKGELQEEFGEKLEKVEEDINKISEKLDKEISDRTEADEALTEAINNEADRAKAAESAITESLNTLSAATENEIARAISAETALQAAINQEIKDRQSEDNAILEQLGTEETERKAEDEKIRKELQAEVERAKAAETAETDRATAKETELDNKITAETNRATAKEGEIEAKLDKEIARATAAESAITASLNTLSATTAAEIERATAKDAELDDKIAKEAEARFNNDVKKEAEVLDLMQGGSVSLKNNSGETLFTIVFDGNYGTI